MANFDIVGIGQNAVDTLILAEHYPAHGGKERFGDEMVSPGGQVATAAVTCARLGLRTSYIGTLGDDERGRTQRESLLAEGIDIASVLVRPECATQTAYIVIDKSTGERTVLWRRDAGLALRPEEVQPEWIAGARMVHLDAGDLAATTDVAQMARAMKIPVSLDADTIYPELGALFANVDYLIAAQGLLEKWTGESDTARAIEKTQQEYGCRVVGVTLGAEGSLLRGDGALHYSPGFVLEDGQCLDTTGAGDVFHGAFCYSVLNAAEVNDMNCIDWNHALDFANALAALNCRGYGARGAISTQAAAMELIANSTNRRRWQSAP